MAMLNLTAYAKSTLQHCSALLTQARSAGIIEIDVLLGSIDSHLRESALTERKAITANDRRVGRTVERAHGAGNGSAPVCPSCALGHLVICRETSSIVGHPVLVCTRHCGYSEVKE